MSSSFAKVLDTLSESDPELRKMVEMTLEELATRLGESPEAWRGAEATADLVVNILGAGERLVMGGRAAGAHALLTAVMSVAVALSMHPMTPWGQEHADVPKR